MKSLKLSLLTVLALGFVGCEKKPEPQVPQKVERRIVDVVKPIEPVKSVKPKPTHAEANALFQERMAEIALERKVRLDAQIEAERLNPTPRPAYTKPLRNKDIPPPKTRTIYTDDVCHMTQGEYEDIYYTLLEWHEEGMSCSDAQSMRRLVVPDHHDDACFALVAQLQWGDYCTRAWWLARKGNR